MKSDTKNMIVDMFCGAGGTSTGVRAAARKLGIDMDLIAINHWDVAISTHSTNHPEMRHYNSDLIAIDPHLAVPSGHLKLLVASPECTHFSRARGGKPMSKQSRASVKYVLSWMHALDIENAVIENVPEFMDWGPLHRQCVCGAGPYYDVKHAKDCKFATPIKNRKGEYFHRFIMKLRELGYNVEWRILNAADYGDPTTRRRLFIMARKGKPVRFPEPTHHREGGDMFGIKPRWRTAREIIDWSIKGESIYNRKKPLAENTMRRIEAGLLKYNGKAFVLGQQSGAVARDVDQPIPTVAGAGAISLIQPFIIALRGTADSSVKTSHRSVDNPLPTITGGNHLAVVQPFIIQMDMGGRLQSMDDPMNTLTSADARALVQPFLVEYHNGENSERRTRSIDQPLPTLDTSNRFGLAEPFIVEYYGTGQAQLVEEPMKTITGRDRFGLVEPIVFEHNGKKYLLDILFRMLQPHELAAAMSFPKGYKFQGTREQMVKQIGNAVPVRLAEALATAALT